MDASSAERIAEKLRARYPNAQLVYTGGWFVNVYWSEMIEGELRSYVLGDGGSFAVDTYRGDYLKDDEALFLWPHEFDEDLTEDQVVVEIRGGRTPKDIDDLVIDYHGPSTQWP